MLSVQIQIQRICWLEDSVPNTHILPLKVKLISAQQLIQRISHIAVGTITNKWLEIYSLLELLLRDRRRIGVSSLRVSPCPAPPPRFFLGRPGPRFFAGGGSSSQTGEDGLLLRFSGPCFCIVYTAFFFFAGGSSSSLTGEAGLLLRFLGDETSLSADS